MELIRFRCRILCYRAEFLTRTVVGHQRPTTGPHDILPGESELVGSNHRGARTHLRRAFHRVSSDSCQERAADHLSPGELDRFPVNDDEITEPPKTYFPCERSVPDPNLSPAEPPPLNGAE